MITAADYDFICRFLRMRSGLVLSEDKQYLIESRLGPVLRQFDIAGIAQLTAKLRDPREAMVQEAVVDAMTTNESFFFRDKTPFDAFTNVLLPYLNKTRPTAQPIRIWCAASSTGQEPYSLAMLVKENAAKLAGRRVEILATDISGEVLARAQAGTYTHFEVQRGLPVQYLVKYFAKDADTWTLSPEIRAMVQYRKLNLLSPLAGLGMFDIVFCRNVLIYFDLACKTDILARIAAIMRSDGYLVLGGAETVVGTSDRFRPCPEQRGLYNPVAPALAKTA